MNSALALRFQLHHVGFVVPTLPIGHAMFGALGFDVNTAAFSDPVQHVTVQFIYPLRDVAIELIAPNHEKSPITRYLNQRGAGLHHLCYEVPNLDEACDYLRGQGSVMSCAPVGAVAFNGRKIAFHYWQRQIVELLEADPAIR